MVPVVDFGRSFCTQSALRFDTDDPAEVGVPGNVCRAQILATCAITRWPSEEAFVAALQRCNQIEGWRARGGGLYERTTVMESARALAGAILVVQYLYVFY